jgi:protein-disulfide isomerase
MARKGATRRTDLGRRSGNAPARRATESGATAAPLRHGTTGLERALLVVLALDGALSLVFFYIHAQLRATHGAYTSFCNVSDRINCDAVLGSPYAELLGVSVATWALLTYLLLGALVVWRRRASEPARARATLLLVGIAAWTVAFSLYMAAVAAFVIGTFCLLCIAMYVLNAIVAVLAWRLARAESRAGPLLSARRTALGAAAIALALAVVGGVQLTATSVATAQLTREEVRTRDPDFYQWYTSRPVVAALPAGEHVKGPADAPITIVEFSDFECTYCARAFRDLHEVERQHRGTVRIAFRHFPLDSECNPHVASHLHRSACLAAIAAECAARYGRFWEYHERLFGAQGRLERDDLVATAAGLGIDRAAFAACLDDPASRARVIEDVEAGARLGVKSTPTLFINGRTVEGALERNSYEYIVAMERNS